MNFPCMDDGGEQVLEDEEVPSPPSSRHHVLATYATGGWFLNNETGTGTMGRVTESVTEFTNHQATKLPVPSEG